MGARDRRGKPEDTFEEGVRRNIKMRFLRQTACYRPLKNVLTKPFVSTSVLWLVLSLSEVAEACKCALFWLLVSAFALYKRPRLLSLNVLTLAFMSHLLKLFPLLSLHLDTF